MSAVIHPCSRRASAQASITASKAVSTRVSNRLHDRARDRVTRRPSRGRMPRRSGSHQPSTAFEPGSPTGIGNSPDR